MSCEEQLAVKTNRWNSKGGRGGGGPWGFGQIILRGVLRVVRKSRGVLNIRVLLDFYEKVFKLYPRPAPGPPCAFIKQTCWGKLKIQKALVCFKLYVGNF